MTAVPEPLDSSTSLPWGSHTIQQLLPHRYPFLFIDRVTSFEPDTRIVGLMTVSANTPGVSALPRGAVPFTVLTEAAAQLGAILVLAKPENRGRPIVFMGIERARYRRGVHAGEVVEFDVRVRRLRRSWGSFDGVGRVGKRVILRGSMSFALGPVRTEREV